MRLRRADPNRPGYTRRRRGKGFSYHGVGGKPLTDPDELGRIRALAIPPAWKDVWICPDPRGHIQAIGNDAAGRKQYRYHDVWRAERDDAERGPGDAVRRVRLIASIEVFRGPNMRRRFDLFASSERWMRPIGLMMWTS